jgi:hypothetical protein
MLFSSFLVASMLDARAGDSLLTLDWSVTGDALGAWVGLSVAPAGDVNGDGYADVVLDAQPYDGATEGYVLVFYGSSAGLDEKPSWAAPSVDGGTYIGGRGAAAGDVNGDGYGDLIVGAYDFDKGGDQGWKAHLYLGSPTGLETTTDWTATSANADEFGFAQKVASAGDVNGDGYDDVLVGSPSHDSPEFSEGEVFLYLGSAAGLEPDPAWSADSNQEYSFFGTSLASAGDVNGDGYDDIVVGAFSYDDPDPSEGAAFLYLGSASGPAESAAWTVRGDKGYANLGMSVSSAGDVDGDGYDDVIVGANGYGGAGSGGGAAFVFLGSASGLATTAAWTVESSIEDAYFGASVACAGDVNVDGFDDIVVGAPYSGLAQGTVSVFLGSATGLDTTPAWEESGDGADATFGISVASAGDVDGNGAPDVLVGAWDYKIGKAGTGAFLYVSTAGGPGPDNDADDDGYDDGEDCDDTNAEVHPGATEVCDDAIDDDCDKSVDEDCGGDDDGDGDAGGGGDDGDASDSSGEDDSGCGCGGGRGAPAIVVMLAIAAVGRRSRGKR